MSTLAKQVISVSFSYFANTTQGICLRIWLPDHEFAVQLFVFHVITNTEIMRGNLQISSAKNFPLYFRTLHHCCSANYGNDPQESPSET